MAIITRFNILEFKEVSFQTPTGLQQYTAPTGTTDPFGNSILGGTYEINDNFDFSGTTDFKNVIRTHNLLAKIEVIEVDTAQLTIQQFMQLTPQQAQNMLGARTRRETIGWVNLGQSLPSFYYENCSGVYNDPILGRTSVPGRLPISRPFFSLGTLTIPLIQNGTKIELVYGEEDGIPALQPIGVYPNDPRIPGGGTLQGILSFGPDPLQYPGMMMIQDFNQYLRFIITPTGASILPGIGGFQNSVTITAELQSVELQRADRDMIVNPQNPRYTANKTDTTESGYVYDDGAKLRWSEPWLIIPDSFPGGLFGPNQNIGSLGTWISDSGGRAEGQCIPFPDIEEPQTPTGDPETGLGPGDVIDIGDDVDTETEFDFDFGCPEPYPLNLPPYDEITQDEINVPFELVEFNISGLQDTIELLRTEYQFQERLFGQRDPREPFLESYTGKNGVIFVRTNRKRCTADIYPALRDKDGDIPEQIGPAMSNYFKNIRKRISSLYGIEGAILSNIGSGSDGYDYYSDGNSYVELLGETVIGCGDQISFGLDLPEIRAEIINNMENKFFYKGSESIPSPYLGISLDGGTKTTVKNVKDAITLHTMDLLYGIMSGEKNFPREDLELLRLINVGSKIQYKSITEYYEKNGFDKITFGLWQNVMYPIYDKLMGRTAKNRYEFKSSESLAKKTYRSEFEIIDNAVSIELTDTINKIVGPTTTTRPIKNWDWLLSKGLGAFTLNFTYKAGPNGLADTQGATAQFSISLNYIAITQLIIGLVYLIYDAVSEDSKDEIPLRENPIEIYDDRLTVTRTLNNKSTTEKISEDEERLRQTPRRIHKKGNVLLESRSGLYDTTTLPCPVIFLGFADDYYNVSPNGRRAFIEKLSKQEIIETNCIKNKNIEFPVIKPRIKKYGRNPLLDIFYLNVVNPYLRTDKGFPASSGNRYSRQRIWSNPNRLPFRSNRSHKNWHMWSELEYGEFPSIFPPNWQYMDQTNWNNRLNTTIIPLEKRWEMSINYETGDTNMPFVVLKDKTPILDLYFGLMEMHVKGISWEEIFQYVDTAIGCVDNNNYLEWSSENKTSMNLEKLERVWKRVEARLEQIDTNNSEQIFMSSLDFGKIKVQNNPTVSKVLVKNNSSVPFTINSIRLVDIVDQFGNSDVDLYQRSSSGYFKILEYQKIIPPSQNHLDYSEITIEFDSSESQPNFRYSCVLLVEGSNGTENIIIQSNIDVTTISDRIVNYYDDIYKSVLELPSSIDFGLVNSDIKDDEIKTWSGVGFSIGQGQPNLKQLVLTNITEYDAIRLDKIYFSSIEMTDYTGQLQTFNDKFDTGFYVMDTKQILVITSIVGKNKNFPYIFEKGSILYPSTDKNISKSRIVYLSLLPTKSGMRYSADLILEYTILPRNTKTRFQKDGIKKQETIKLYGLS